ncbi:MAG: hypothetical protein RLZZ426_1121 [Actinomycetota bacterium]
MKLRSIAVSVASVALLVAGCTQPSTSPSSSFTPDGTLDVFYNQTLKWDDCKDFFECAKLSVPMDYQDLNGPTIEIALMRHVVNNASKRVGALVINPGGPGGSGVDYVESYDSQFTDQIIETFDIVGFDPRGVNKSTPVVCLTDQELDVYLATDPTPDNAAEVAEFNADGAAADAKCAERTGDLLAHVSTLETVKDLDILRAALGESTLNFLGKSYGTQIGALYASMFSDKVGRFVLDGAVDMQLTSAELSLGQAKGFEVAINRFAIYCVESAVVCPLGTNPTKIVAKMKSFIDSLDQKPMKIKGSDRVLTESLGWSSIIGPMYLPDGGWDWLIEGLQAAYKGNGATLLEIADWITGRDYDGTYMDNSTAAFTAISCLDYGKVGSTPEQLESDFVAAAPFFGRVLAWGEGGCANWPVTGELMPRDVAAPNAPAIIVIGTTNDPATPNDWAIALAKQLEVGVYLNFNGDGHTAYLSGSECIDKIVDDFWLVGTVPVNGKICQPDYPFVE